MTHAKETQIVSKTDPFSRVHSLLRNHEYAAALRLLMDSKRFALRKEYRTDENHAWYIVGDIFSKRRRPDLAAKAFRKSLRARPRDSEALWALGNSYSDLRRPALAERYLRAALRNARRNSAAIRYNLGNALFDQCKNLSAITTYKRIRPSAGRTYRLAQKNIQHAMKRLGK